MWCGDRDLCRVGNALSQYGEKKGKVLQGSPDVFFESKAVARVGDLVECSDHGGPQFVAEGARTVFANGRPIARIGHSRLVMELWWAADKQY